MKRLEGERLAGGEGVFVKHVVLEEGVGGVSGGSYLKWFWVEAAACW